MSEATALKNLREALDRAEAAEARVKEYETTFDGVVDRALRAEARVKEAEAALREIAEDAEPNHYSRLQKIARMALAHEEEEA